MSSGPEFRTLSGSLFSQAAYRPKMWAGKPFLIQCHWQNQVYFQETEFIAQGEFQSPEDAIAWASGVFERHAEERPEGHLPMICTEDSEYFVKAVQPTAIVG